MRIAAHIGWLLVLLSVVALAGAIACGDDDDDDDATADDDDDDLGDDDDSPDNTPPNPPDVDDVLSPTALTVQTLTGRAEAGAEVTVTGGAQSAAGDADPNSGEFCVVVPLKTNQVNELEVVATDRWLNESDPVEVEIEQDESLYPEEANASLADTASVSASSESTTDCPGCTANKSIDGNTSTWWQNSTNPLNGDSARTPQWLTVDLGDVYEIARAEVLWGSDYGVIYDLYYSTYSNPIPPHETLAQWTPVVNVVGGDGDTDSLDLPEPVRARYWSLVLGTSNRQNIIPPNHYYHRVHEFRLFGVLASEVPEDPGCN